MAVDRKMRVPPPSTQAGQVNVPVSAGLPNFSQPPPVINRTPTNLITVPIQDNNTSGSTGSGAPPPASDYWTTNKFNQPPPSYYQRPPPNHYQSSQQQSSYEWTGSRTGSSGYHRRWIWNISLWANSQALCFKHFRSSGMGMIIPYFRNVLWPDWNAHWNVVWNAFRFETRPWNGNKFRFRIGPNDH